MKTLIVAVLAALVVTSQSQTPAPIPPRMPLSQAQTLARSTRNPQAQAEGQRQLAAWQTYYNKFAVWQAEQAGQISPTRARLRQMEYEAEDLERRNRERMEELERRVEEAEREMWRQKLDRMRRGEPAYR